MGAVTMMWQIGLIPLLATQPAVAEKPQAAVAEKAHRPAVAEPRTEGFRLALTITSGRDWLASTDQKTIGSTPLETASGLDPFSGESGPVALSPVVLSPVVLSPVVLSPVDPSRQLAENAGPFGNTGSGGINSRSISEATGEEEDFYENIIQECAGISPSERPVSIKPITTDGIILGGAGIISQSGPEISSVVAPEYDPSALQGVFADPGGPMLPPRVQAALTATAEPFWPLPYRVCGSSIGSDLCDYPAATPLRMALGIAEAGELPIRLLKPDPVAVLADYLTAGLFSGSVVSDGDDFGFEAARRLLGYVEPAGSEMVSLTAPPLTPPWGPFPLWTYRGDASANRLFGIGSNRRPVNCSPLNLAFGPHEERYEPIALFNPDSEKVIAAYTAGRRWNSQSESSPSPLRDPGQLVSETFGATTAKWELDGLFFSGRDGERLAGDVSAAFWQNLAGAGRTSQVTLAAELLNAWNDRTGTGAWSRGRREHRLDLGDEILTADLSLDRLPWTPAGLPNLMDAIPSEQPTWSFPTR